MNLKLTQFSLIPLSDKAVLQTLSVDTFPLDNPDKLYYCTFGFAVFINVT